MCHRQKNKKKYVKVIINKEEENVEEGLTIKRLLEERDMKSRTSVWVNGEQLLLADYPTHVVQEGDEIKILRIVAGG